MTLKHLKHCYTKLYSLTVSDLTHKYFKRGDHLCNLQISYNIDSNIKSLNRGNIAIIHVICLKTTFIWRYFAINFRDQKLSNSAGCYLLYYYYLNLPCT